MGAIGNKREAWAWIAAIIEGAPEMLNQDAPNAGPPSGLCRVVWTMYGEGAITLQVRDAMLRDIDRALDRLGAAYLTHPFNWTNGERLAWAQYFAREGRGRGHDART